MDAKAAQEVLELGIDNLSLILVTCACGAGGFGNLFRSKVCQ